MSLITSPIPSISITLAPPEKTYPEPYSPIPPAKLDAEEDGYRARWLSLPHITNRSQWHSSPLRPIESPPRNGLGRNEFNSLLKMSRDQRARAEMQGIPNLRKEVALKNQKLKQLERRALFLSKVKEPPASMPEVPRESPTTAHCFSSPRGFEPDTSTLEVAAGNPRDSVVNLPTGPEQNEQVARGPPIVEKRLPSSRFPRAAPKKSTCFSPSLDEIAARLKPMHASFKRSCSRPRLPNFLITLSLSPSPTDEQIKAVRAQRPDPCALKLGSRRLVIPHTVDIAV